MNHSQSPLIWRLFAHGPSFPTASFFATGLLPGLLAVTAKLRIMLARSFHGVVIRDADTGKVGNVGFAVERFIKAEYGRGRIDSFRFPFGLGAPTGRAYGGLHHEMLRGVQLLRLVVAGFHGWAFLGRPDLPLIFRPS